MLNCAGKFCGDSYLLTLPRVCVVEFAFWPFLVRVMCVCGALLHMRAIQHRGGFRGTNLAISRAYLTGTSCVYHCSLAVTEPPVRRALVGFSD